MIWTRSVAIGVVALSVLAAALVGCAASLSLRTAPAQPAGANDECNSALINGVLIQDAESGLGLRDGAGSVRDVVWPFGFSARRESFGAVLVDRAGQIVAREGDHIQMTGGYGNGDAAYPCFEPHLVVR